MPSMAELCNIKMMADSVPDEQSLFCNDTKGHIGQHSYTTPLEGGLLRPYIWNYDFSINRGSFLVMGREDDNRILGLLPVATIAGDWLSPDEMHLFAKRIIRVEHPNKIWLEATWPAIA